MSNMSDEKGPGAGDVAPPPEESGDLLPQSDTPDALAAPEEWLKVSDVAKLLGGLASTKTISRWADQGDIPHSVTLGKHRRFRRSDAEALRDKLIPPEDS